MIKSLTESFIMNRLSVVLLNETWLYRNDKQAKHSILQEIKNEAGIEVLRKDRDSREGGVVIAFRSEDITLKSWV